MEGGDIMKVLFSPQFDNEKRIKYSFFENIIKIEEMIRTDKDDSEDGFEVEHTFYVDLSNLEEGKPYHTVQPLVNLKKDLDGIHIELMNYIGYEASEEERFPEWFEPEDEEFEIDEDAEVVELEEIEMPEPPAPPFNPESLQAENFELNRKLSSLQSSMAKNQRDTEDLILSLMMML